MAAQSTSLLASVKVSLQISPRVAAHRDQQLKEFLVEVPLLAYGVSALVSVFRGDSKALVVQHKVKNHKEAFSDSKQTR